MTGYGSLPFSAAFVGVAVVAFGLDYGVQAAEEYKEKVNKNIFDQYFKDYAKFDEKHWYKLFVDAYWDEWQNGTRSVEGIEEAYKTVLDEMEEYSETFWADVFKEGSDALTFAVAEAGKTNYYTPTEDQKAMYVEEFKRYMNIRFKEKVIPWIERFLLEQQQDALYASLYKLCEPFNEYYRVQVQEIAPIDSGDTCKYQEHTIRFGNESGFTLIDIPDTWTLNAPQDDDQWAVTSEFTCLSYLLAGAPDRIMLFPKDSDETDPKDAVLTQKFDWYTGDDIFEDDPALTQEFNATEKVTVISLKVASGEGLPLNEIIGTYDINYETSASGTINNYIAKDGDSLVLSDSDGFNEPATLSYDPLKGMAYGKHTYSKVYATGVDEITVIYKLYFTRENGGITMTGVGSQTINGNPAGSWSYNEKKIN